MTGFAGDEWIKRDFEVLQAAPAEWHSETSGHGRPAGGRHVV